MLAAAPAGAQNSYTNFTLGFVTSGMGSNMGSMQPYFRVKGTSYCYTYEQNSSYWGKKTKEADTICTGQIRSSSMDSILALVAGLKDTLTTEIGSVMSGAYQSLWIEYGDLNRKFHLHNSTHPVAEKIVDILNSNIPAGKPRLWLFGYVRNREDMRINYTTY